MIYKTFKDLHISQLGMGNMRLPVDADGSIDTEQAQRIIDYAFDHGVNYYDTAYVYHKGESESFLGNALRNRPRDRYFLATKFPGFLFTPGQNPKDIFEEQLRRCRTGYFDFYLMHNVNEKSIGTYTDEQLRLLDYFAGEQRNGRIRYLGFSSHGKPETLAKFADHHEWDFAQIQLNYLDWTLQDAKTQYEILTERRLPVIVMEPVRGGSLADLTPEANALLKAAEPERSIASWSFRWLTGLENVLVVLSGMSTLEQLKDNIATFDRPDPLTAEQEAVLMKACELFRNHFNVPCTACRYCCDDCPQQLNIPDEHLQQLQHHAERRDHAADGPAQGKRAPRELHRLRRVYAALSPVDRHPRYHGETRRGHAHTQLSRLRYAIRSATLPIFK